jgi:hypothetical protein
VPFETKVYHTSLVHVVCPQRADPQVVDVAPILFPFTQVLPDTGIAIGVAFKQSSFNGCATTAELKKKNSKHNGANLYIVLLILGRLLG